MKENTEVGSKKTERGPEWDRLEDLWCQFANCRARANLGASHSAWLAWLRIRSEHGYTKTLRERINDDVETKEWLVNRLDGISQATIEKWLACFAFYRQRLNERARFWPVAIIIVGSFVSFAAIFDQWGAFAVAMPVVALTVGFERDRHSRHEATLSEFEHLLRERIGSGS
jgi:hypothetical protein